VVIGAPPGAEHWSVAIQHPAHSDQSVAVVPLRDQSLSISAVHGKAFIAEGRFLGHVIDPRTGQPVLGAQLAAVAMPSATDSDALSTALLIRGEPWLPPFQERWPDARGWVVGSDAG
jgi:FAD:protein FMN transferase